MKDFSNSAYLEDIRKKIPGYDLMLELIFHSILKVEFPTSKIDALLSIAGQTEEIKSLLTHYQVSNISLIEPNEVMMQLVKEECHKLKNAERIQYSCLNFENYEVSSQYNLCICLLVLQFVENPKAFLEKIYHALFPQGKLILSIFSKEQLDYWKEFALAKGANPEQVEKTFSQQETVMKALSPSFVETLFQEVGFTKITKVCQILSTTMWIVEK